MKKAFISLETLVGLALAGLILSVPIPYSHPETVYNPVPLTYETASPLSIQEKTDFLWLKSNYGSIAIKNTDTTSGTYTVDFIFNKDGKITDTKSVSQEISAGTVKVFETKVPSDVQVTTNIIPPNKQIPSVVTATDQVPLYKFIFVTKDFLR
jgi:hypothetical protein